MKRYKLPKQKYRWLSSAEGRRLIDVAEGQMKAFVAVGINTGLRKGEIFRLEWEDIDLEREELTVREAKGGEFRVIPMNEELVQILRKHPRHITSPYVFHRSNGEPWQDARKSYWETLNRAKLPTTFRFHDMRHTFISNLVAQGEDLRSVQELAGHKDIRTTMQYAHLAPGRLKEAVSRLKWEAG